MPSRGATQRRAGAERSAASGVRARVRHRAVRARGVLGRSRGSERGVWRESDAVVRGRVDAHLGDQAREMEPGSRAEAEAAAAEILAAANGAGLFVQDVTEREVSRRARPPFTTSTMQQEASSRLGFGASRTMSAAQSLYEGRNWGRDSSRTCARTVCTSPRRR